MNDRERMIETIVSEARHTGDRTGRRALHAHVLDAMRRVPREAFVPDELADQAYDDRPLPIGNGQTISQPFIVALMTDLLEPGPADRVLEVGTGCGYQAAVLAELMQSVYSVEYLPRLADAAAERLQHLGYRNVHVRSGDGRDGWPEQAPFDAIIVTAGAPDVPETLVAQLARGGRMVIPTGSGRMGQDLCVIRRHRDGTTDTQSVLPVAFVPLQGR